MDPVLTCAGCGDRIGVYEPLWWEQPDGSITDAALLALGQDARSGRVRSRFYHHGCLPPADLPRES